MILPLNFKILRFEPVVNRARFDLDRSWEATALGSRVRLTFVEQGDLRLLFMLDWLEVFLNQLGVARAYRLGFEGQSPLRVLPLKHVKYSKCYTICGDYV